MTNPEPIPFQPDRFRSAAAHYLQGRPAYAEALIRDVALLCGLDGTGSLLDLGCGPGQLARAFRPHVADALGLDPEPEMLEVARRVTGEAGLDVAFREGSSQDLVPGMGPFRLVTIGRAFHWMDRPETARRLDELLVPGGSLVLFSADAMDVPENAWKVRFEAALETATGASRRQPWRSPGWVRNDMLLLSSPLSALRRMAVIERRRTPGTALLDRALSMSSTTRARLGDGLTDLRTHLDEVIAEVADLDGMVSEVVESIALIAQRPDRS